MAGLQPLGIEGLAPLNMQAVRDDVSPFMERPQDAALLTRENFEGLLQDESPEGG